jgi:hypothetical protein
MQYILDRLNERDTKVVLAAAAYTVARTFVPPQYLIFVDAIASAFGIGVAATPMVKKD